LGDTERGTKEKGGTTRRKRAGNFKKSVSRLWTKIICFGMRGGIRFHAAKNRVKKIERLAGHTKQRKEIGSARGCSWGVIC